MQNIFWRFKPFTGHSMDTQQWAVWKTSNIVGKFSACKFIKKFWVHIHDLCIQKQSCLPWGSDAFWKFSACKIYRKSFGRNFTIYASKSKVVCREVQRYFGRCTPARFTEKVLGAWSQFIYPKTKLFAVKFRRILDVVRLQGLQKKFSTQFCDLCVQKRSCFPWSSDIFGKF